MRERGGVERTSGGTVCALAARNLAAYLDDQREATGVVPDDRTIVVERFRDEIGDWRICVLSPFGGRVHAPWAMAIEARMGAAAGIEVEAMWSDDGIIFLGIAKWNEKSASAKPAPAASKADDQRHGRACPDHPIFRVLRRSLMAGSFAPNNGRHPDAERPRQRMRGTRSGPMHLAVGQPLPARRTLRPAHLLHGVLGRGLRRDDVRGAPSTPRVMVGLGPTIQPSARSGAR